MHCSQLPLVCENSLQQDIASKQAVHVIGSHVSTMAGPLVGDAVADTDEGSILGSTAGASVGLVISPSVEAANGDAVSTANPTASQP
jgi:hypothetical protein